jgi:undecaprenyl-diphosphatase
MKPIDAFIYGSIQGLSEFLPVSSSGHLALLPHVMKIEDPGVVFDLMMHLGTALAVMAYFFKDLKNYAKTFTPKLIKFSSGTPHQWFVRNFIFATLVSVFFIVLFLPLSKLARNPYAIIFNLITFGILLAASDWLHKNKSHHLDAPFELKMQWKLAFLIGFAQALAIFPGVSRSGITLTAALFVGLKRKDAGHFSFLLSLPIILAGILKEIPDLMGNRGGDELLPLLIGVLTSFVVGYLTIHYFLKLLARIELYLFSLYRILIALLMLVIL